MSFSFIHISDIHLGRPFSGLSDYSADIDVSKALNRAFNNFLDFAIEKQVDFVLISGDTFDSNEQDFDSKLILKNGLKKLEKEGIKVFLIAGNHDCLASYSKTAFDFDENSNIKIVGLNTNFYDKFIVTDKSGDNCAIIHALSFRESSFNENPCKYFNPPTGDEKELFNIGLLHCDLSGQKDSPYAPCSYSDLEALNYDYFALGHIHIPSESGKIQYAGTLQGRNTKETGAHGVKYIKVEEGKIIENSFIPLDVVRFEDIDIDLSNSADVTSSAGLINDKISDLINKNENQTCELFLIRVNLTGCVKFFNEINDEFYLGIIDYIKQESNSKCYISQIINNTQALADIETIKSDEGIAGGIYNKIQDENFLIDICNSELELFDKLIKTCDFNDEEYQTFKSEVINQTKEACINLCGIICTDEAEAS